MDQFTTFSTGDKLKLSAELHANLVRVVQKELESRGDFKPSGADLDAELSLWIKNKKGTDLGKYSVVRRGNNLVGPETSDESYTGPLVYESLAPSATSPFAILQSPAKNNAIVPAVMSGITLVKVNVTDSSHKFANAIDGDYTKLLSQAAAGPAEILWTSGATGTVWALVRLNGTPATDDDSDCACCDVGDVIYLGAIGLPETTTTETFDPFEAGAFNPASGYQGTSLFYTKSFAPLQVGDKITIDVRGADGAGAVLGGGGGGAGFARVTYTLQAGDTIRYTATGSGAVGFADPGDVTFEIINGVTTTLIAKAASGKKPPSVDLSAPNTIAPGGAGGSVDDCIGDLVYGGGDGGAGLSVSYYDGYVYCGGGGGSAGPGGPGSNGQDAIDGTPGAGGKGGKTGKLPTLNQLNLPPTSDGGTGGKRVAFVDTPCSPVPINGFGQIVRMGGGAGSPEYFYDPTVSILSGGPAYIRIRWGCTLTESLEADPGGSELQNPVLPSQGGLGLDASDADAGLVPITDGDGKYILGSVATTPAIYEWAGF